MDGFGLVQVGHGLQQEKQLQIPHTDRAPLGHENM